MTNKTPSKTPQSRRPRPKQARAKQRQTPKRAIIPYNRNAMGPMLKRVQAMRITSSISDQLARFIMLPRDSAKLRLPFQSTMGIKTALSNFLYRGASVARNTVGAADNDEIASGAWYLTRSPVAPLWEMFTFAVAGGTALWGITFAPQIAAKTYHTDFNVTVDSVNSVLTTHGPPPMTDGKSPTPFVYYPTGTQFQVRIFGAGATSSIIVRLRYYLSPTIFSEIALPSITTDASGNATYSANSLSFGWYTIESVEAALVAIPITATFVLKIVSGSASTSTVMLPAFQPFEASTAAALIYSQTRVGATALLVTNDTPELYRAGRLVCARLPSNDINFCDVSSMYQATTVAPKNQSYQGDASKGVYTFTVPDSRAMELTDYYQTLQGTTNLYLHLDDLAFVNAVFYKGGIISQSGSIGAAIQTFAIELDLVVEYATNNQIVTVSTARGTVVDYDSAIKRASAGPPFSENPGHWAFVRRAVMGLARIAYPYARPYIRRGVQNLSQRIINSL